MLESDLSKPVSDWLTAKGFTPYAEVPFPTDGARTIDIVGRKGTELVAVEMKRSLTNAVIHQTYMCDLITDQRFAAVGTKPRQKAIERCRKVGIGLLSVREGVVNLILQPREIIAVAGQEWLRESYAKPVHATLDRMTPNGVGGVPCMKGVGPAQECYDRVQAYITAHPTSKWREIFADVPNHYDSYKNMYSAMKFVSKRRIEALNLK